MGQLEVGGGEGMMRARWQSWGERRPIYVCMIREGMKILRLQNSKGKELVGNNVSGLTVTYNYKKLDDYC